MNMLTNNQEALYQNISRVCRIIIPVLYLLIAIIAFAFFFVPIQILFDLEAKAVINGIEINAFDLPIFDKYLIGITMAAILGLALNLIWQTISVLKRFKNKEVFSENTAKHAYRVALSLFLIFIGKLILGIYISIKVGDLNVDFSELITAAFAYLTAWILNIGSQLKAENDLTV